MISVPLVGTKLFVVQPSKAVTTKVPVRYIIPNIRGNQVDMAGQ